MKPKLSITIMMNKKKLSQTILKYFANTIGFSCRITPAPNTSLELDYLLQNFQKLAPLDNFQTSSDSIRDHDHHDYHHHQNGFFINAIYNPCQNESWFKLIKLDENHQLFKQIDNKLINNYNNNNNNNNNNNQTIKNDFIKILTSLVAIPRYSYIENNQQFQNYKLQLRFDHNLQRSITNYKGKYNLTTSTIDNPFISIINNKNDKNGKDDEVQIDYEKLRVNLRHNFQKFHKFDKIEIITNPNRLINKLK